MIRPLRLLIALSALSALALFAPLPARAQEVPIRGVVELFTSQGCSSCPPADALLADYAKRDDVLALSWHVDYWNYLGWQDTFSDAVFTRRQRQYGSALGARVYTPQAVVNGRGHAVGSQKGAIDALLNRAGGGPLPVTLRTRRTKDGLRITASARIDAATLWIVYYAPRREVEIRDGENGGRSVSYHNVVRAVDMAGMMKDGVLDVTLPIAAVRAKGAAEKAGACALLLQATRPSGDPSSYQLGPILGAARIGDL